MRYRRLIAIVLVAMVAGACSAGSSSSAPGSPAASAPISGAATRVEIKLTDSFRMEPSAFRVPAGRAVTFVVTNSGAIDHEFYVGDEAAQMAHAKSMPSMGGMGQDVANGLALKPGQTKELVVTFDTPGTTIAGCHEPGHYGAGMRANIEIVS